jgi:hypothetical protein
MTYEVQVTCALTISDDFIAAVIEGGPYAHRIALYQSLLAILEAQHPSFATMLNAKRIGEDMIDRGLLEPDIDRDHRLAAEANAKSLRHHQIAELKNLGPFVNELDAIDAVKRVIWRNTQGTISTRIAAAVVQDLQAQGLIEIETSSFLEFTTACLSTILGQNITLGIGHDPAQA